MTKIYFDMDGTIAALYSVENWLPMLRAEDSTPYRIAKPMVNITELNVFCGILRRFGYQVGIISWLSKGSSESYDRAVTEAKLGWLKHYFPACGSEIHIVKYGTPKHEVVNPHGAILFDDEERNGIEWRKAGGIWYNPKEIKIEKILKEMAGF